MINLQFGLAGQKVIVTLAEKLTLTENYLYRFEFTNTITKQVVTWEQTPGQDESTYPQRFNQFPIDVDEVFADYQTGEYLYEVYEVDTETEEVGALLENGKLLLISETEFEYVAAADSTTYIAASE